jgi:hypothetical protein
VARRTAFALAGILSAACGALLGIEPLQATDDAGVVVPPVPREAEASPVVVDAKAGDDAAEVAPPRRPPEGTYVYAVTGSENLTGVLGFNAIYGPTATATVTHVGADCFTLTINLRANYDETMSFCIKGLEVTQDAGTRRQQFGLAVTAQTTTECKPGDVYATSAPTPNQAWTHACSGKNTDDKSGQSAFVTGGPYRYVGSETIGVAGADAPVRHYRGDRTVSGAQSGTSVSDWYLGAEDGVLVRLSRNVDIDYPSVVGRINYRESALMTLTTRPAPSGDAGDGGG